MLSAFCDDGYTRDGVIDERPRQWPRLAFSYRPLAASEVAEHLVKAKGLDDVAWHRAVAGILARKIVSWDMRTSSDKPVEVSESNLLRVMEPVLLRLWEIVAGNAPDDGTDEKNSPAG